MYLKYWALTGEEKARRSSSLLTCLETACYSMRRRVIVSDLINLQGFSCLMVWYISVSRSCSKDMKVYFPNVLLRGHKAPNGALTSISMSADLLTWIWLDRRISSLILYHGLEMHCLCHSAGHCVSHSTSWHYLASSVSRAWELCVRTLSVCIAVSLSVYSLKKETEWDTTCYYILLVNHEDIEKEPACIGDK